MLIWAALPRDLRSQTRPIAASDYGTAGRFKYWLTREVFNAVYVSRQRSDDQDRLVVAALQGGDSLVIFPEGTRNNKRAPQPFKSGLYHLAEPFPAVSLIPAWIDNVQRVMPKGEVVPVPILCSVTFGAPLAGGRRQARLPRTGARRGDGAQGGRGLRQRTFATVWAERRAAPEPARASRETRLAFVASKPAQAGSEPRHSLPSGDRPTYPLGEGLH